MYTMDVHVFSHGGVCIDMNVGADCDTDIVMFMYGRGNDNTCVDDCVIVYMYTDADMDMSVYVDGNVVLVRMVMWVLMLM